MANRHPAIGVINKSSVGAAYDAVTDFNHVSRIAWRRKDVTMPEAIANILMAYQALCATLFSIKLKEYFGTSYEMEMHLRYFDTSYLRGFL